MSWKFKNKSDLQSIKERILSLYPTDINDSEEYFMSLPVYINPVKLITIQSVRKLFLEVLPLGLRFHALFLNSWHLSERDYNYILRKMWVKSYYPNRQSNSVIVSLFKMSNPVLLLKKNELKTIQELPDNVLIYRGVETAKHKFSSLSWTTDPNVAESFAHRHEKLLIKKERKILQARIKKKYILAYFNSGKISDETIHETEVIVNPKYLKDIKVYKAIK